VTARKTSTPGNEHFKVRIVLPGALLHLASKTEPKLNPGFVQGRSRLTSVEADWISDPDVSDTVGYIDWPAVVGITWRYTGSN
jgi:hypothetical protein